VSQKLREAAELFANLSRDAGRELTYDDAGVAWADQYVEAVRPVETEDQLRVQTALVGAFLGEALLAQHGGAWSEDEGEWSVVLEDGRRIHPFRATMAQLTGDAAESIHALFRFVANSAEGADGDVADAGITEPDATPIREAARRFADAIHGNGGPEEYGDEMMQFVHGFVEGTRPVEPGLMDQYATLIGAVLGESIIATHGGEWTPGDEGWSVRHDTHRVLPFDAARRHLEEGPEASVLIRFRQVAEERKNEAGQDEG